MVIRPGHLAEARRAPGQPRLINPLTEGSGHRGASPHTAEVGGLTVPLLGRHIEMDAQAGTYAPDQRVRASLSPALTRRLGPHTSARGHWIARRRGGEHSGPVRFGRSEKTFINFPKEREDIWEDFLNEFDNQRRSVICGL